MNHFAIGTLSFVVAVVFVVAYLAHFQLRRLGAWSKREEGPKDRVGFFVVVTAVLGLAVGSFAQPLWDKGAECRAAGQPLAACVFLPKSP